jgi:hypothetical protein
LDKCIVASVADGLVLIVSAMILILLDLCYVLPKASLLSVPPLRIKGGWNPQVLKL